MSGFAWCVFLYATFHVAVYLRAVWRDTYPQHLLYGLVALGLWAGWWLLTNEAEAGHAG